MKTVLRTYLRGLSKGHVLCVLSHQRLFATPWTSRQAPLFPGSSRQEYWSGLSFPPPEDLPNPSLLCLLHWQADSLPLSRLGNPKTTYFNQFPRKKNVSREPFSSPQKYIPARVWFTPSPPWYHFHIGRLCLH